MTTPARTPVMGRVRVLYAAELWEGSTGLQRLRAMEGLGLEVVPFDMHPGASGSMRSLVDAVLRRGFRAGVPVQAPRDWSRLNRRLLEAAEVSRPHLAWIDKGTGLSRSTLSELRGLCGLGTVIGYSLDDMAGRHNQTQWFLESLPCYDHFITTKSYGVRELRALGARSVLFVNNAFDPACHRTPPDDGRPAFTAALGFVGVYEEERHAAISTLAEAGLRVCVTGTGRWPRYGTFGTLEIKRGPVWADAYARAIWSTQINLGFLRKCNRDLQTTRSIEIPACGGFMLAERTDEHLALFHEGVEAEFFSSVEELLEKARFYEARPELCRQIGAAGRARCERSGYSYEHQIAGILRTVLPARGGERHDA
jgi:spore maturation protein CgeB